MISIMTIGLLAASSMAIASGETLEQSDSLKLFGETSSDITTLNKDEMKKTNGKYWAPYFDYYTNNYNYDYDSISSINAIGNTTSANQVSILGGVIPVVSTTTIAAPTINGGTNIISE